MLFIPLPLPGSSVAEQVTVNHLVVGSTPTRAAIFSEWRTFFEIGKIFPHRVAIELDTIFCIFPISRKVRNFFGCIAHFAEITFSQKINRENINCRLQARFSTLRQK